MSKKVSRIIKNIVTVVLCLILVIIASSIIISSVNKKPIPIIFGYGACRVISGSMEPTLSIDDIIIVKEKVTPKVDDMVLYTSDGSLVVHRIVNIYNDGKTIVTKGDANNANDIPFNSSQIVGKVVGVIPEIGSVIAFFKSIYGIITLILAVVIIYSAVYIFNYLRKKE